MAAVLSSLIWNGLPPVRRLRRLFASRVPLSVEKTTMAVALSSAGNRSWSSTTLALPDPATRVSVLAEVDSPAPRSPIRRPPPVKAKIVTAMARRRVTSFGAVG